MTEIDVSLTLDQEQRAYALEAAARALRPLSSTAVLDPATLLMVATWVYAGSFAEPEPEPEMLALPYWLTEFVASKGDVDEDVRAAFEVEFNRQEGYTPGERATEMFHVIKASEVEAGMLTRFDRFVGAPTADEFIVRWNLESRLDDATSPYGAEIAPDEPVEVVCPGCTVRERVKSGFYAV